MLFDCTYHTFIEESFVYTATISPRGEMTIFVTKESVSAVKRLFLEESLLTTILLFEGLSIAGPAKATSCSLISK